MLKCLGILIMTHTTLLAIARVLPVPLTIPKTADNYN